MVMLPRLTLRKLQPTRRPRLLTLLPHPLMLLPRRTTAAVAIPTMTTLMQPTLLQMRQRQPLMHQRPIRQREP